MKMFSVYDSKAQFYSNPFCAKSTGEALRSFESAANDSQSNISKYPADFTLFELGEFDEVKCEFKISHAKVSLGCAIEFVRSV